MAMILNLMADGGRPLSELVGALPAYAMLKTKVTVPKEKLAAGLMPQTNDFYMYYFILTGIHLFHLVIGVGVLGVLARLSARKPVSAHQFAFVEGAACYWHMVDMLWIVLFPLLYFLR